MEENGMIDIVLKPKEEGRLASGHLWVFSNEISNIDTSIKAGTLCNVKSSRGQQLGIGFFNPHSLISVRLLKTGEGGVEKSFIKRRIKAAHIYRKKLGLDKFCRLVFGESDMLPGLVIDRYGDYFSVDVLSAGMEAYVEDVIAALQELFEAKGILMRNDSEFRKLEGLTNDPRVVGDVPEVAEIEENGVRYKVPIRLGQKTGYYYDQRENREMLKPFFKGSEVLDLYTYVGSFAITAALAGADKVWGIDSSPLAVEHARMNAELNGVADKVAFHKDDAERALSALRSGELPSVPDIILLDPPNYVRNKKNLPQAAHHYVKLNEMALGGLESGGLLATSTCAHHISREIFTDILREAAKASGKRVQLLELRGQAKDHPVLVGMPETEYLHFALLRVL